MTYHKDTIRSLPPNGYETNSHTPSTVRLCEISIDRQTLCGDVAGALESARECVRIYDKLGITNEYSQDAGNLLKRLQDRG
jgi:hypothetical protein